MKLRHNEQKVADVIALPIALVLAILFYIGKIVVKALFRVKRFLFKLSIAVFLLYNAYNTFQYVAYAPKAEAALDGFTYVKSPTTERQQIINFIYDTFGKDADNALKVFTCESGLNPRAYNDNTSWGGIGHDLGVAQINDHYQGVTNAAFLYNYKINILMAKQIFDKWGHNFHAWTCGKKLGL